MRKPTVIDKNELFKELDYTPHSPGQREVHTSTERFLIGCCGRRWGKSLSFGHDLTAYAFTPDAYYWICGPTYKLGEKEFRVVHRDLEKLGVLAHKDTRKSYNVNQGSMRIELPWNTVIEVVSAEKQESLLGDGLDGVIMSEAARHKSETWTQYVEPALSDKRGWANFPSTPRGHNWFEGLFDMGQHPDFPDYRSYRFPTWDNLKMFPGGRNDPEIKRLEQIVSKTYFGQEYAALFTSFQGQIYDEFDPIIHVADIPYNPAWRNYWVFDFGFSDPFVCLDIMVDSSNNVYVWREYQVRYVSTFEHAIRLKERPNPQGFHLNGMFGDPRGADEIATLALVMGHIMGRDVPWKMGIEAVKRHLKLQPDGRPKLFFDRSCTETIRQVEQLRMKDQKEGKNAPEGQHDYDDHGADALRYFFNEYFVLGAGGSLSDVYSHEKRRTEAETFFQTHTHVNRKNELIPFGW